MFRNFIKITDLTQFHQNHPFELRTNYGNHESIFQKCLHNNKITLLSTKVWKAVAHPNQFYIRYRTNVENNTISTKSCFRTFVSDEIENSFKW